MKKNEVTTFIGALECNQNDTPRLSSILAKANDLELFQLLSEETTMFKDINKIDNMVLISFRYIEIIRMPSFMERIKIKTFPYETNRVMGYRHTYLYVQYNNPIIKLHSEGPLFDLVNNHLLRFDLSKIKTLNKYPKQDIVINKTNITEDIELIKLADVTITNDLVDRFKHVNNTKYLQIFEQFLQVGYNYLEIYYKRPAYLGDNLSIYSGSIDTHNVLQLHDNNNNLICRLIYKRGQNEN